MQTAIEEAANSSLAISWWKQLHGNDWDTVIRGYTCIQAAAMVLPYGDERSEWDLLAEIAVDVLIGFSTQKAA